MSELKDKLTDEQREKIMAAFKGNEQLIMDALIALFMDCNIVEDQLVTAIEGGINYWGGIDELKKWTLPKDFKKLGKDEPLSTYVSDVILAGGSVKFFDNEDEDNSDLMLDLNKMVIGFAKMAVKSPSHFSNMISENGDAETADVYIQYCLFGEIVYG